LALVLWVVILGSALVASPASAEWFGDIYAGGAVTENNDLRVKGSFFGVRVDGRFEDVDFDKSFVFGARLGHWFESVRFLGLGVDFFHFQPNIAAQSVTTRGALAGPFLGIPPGPSSGGIVRMDDLEVSVTALSVDLMLRWPLLTSEEFPYGRLQPYVAGGPGAYITDARHFDINVSLGVKAGVGMTWLFTKDIGVFGEVRLIHFRPEVQRGPTRLETTINSGMFLGGLTARF
jgi:hypothetical protein